MKKLVIILTILVFSPSAFAATPIMGQAKLTEYQMETFLHQINLNAPRLAKIFLEEGIKENVRGDLAFAQSLKETGYFRYGGVVQPDYNNYAGIGAVDPTAIGNAAQFDTPREGVRAQIQHLKAYASTESLNLTKIDPRFHLVSRGIAPNLEDLNGRWAVPGNGYGESILKIYHNISQIKTIQKRSINPKLKRLQEKLRTKRKLKERLLKKTRRDFLIENLRRLRSKLRAKRSVAK